MSSRSRISKRDTPRRRKVALACEPCREKKVRCDGTKPICGPCTRRSYSIDRCIYKLENARSASNDAYLKVLHDRIRELEGACVQSGVAVPPAPPYTAEDADSGSVLERSTSRDALGTESRTSAAVEGLLGLGSPATMSENRYPSLTPSTSRTVLPERRSSALLQSTQTSRGQSNEEIAPPSGNLGTYDALRPPTGNVYHSPSLNSHGNVTAMGAISVADDHESTASPQEPYYGNSSAASFMRLARDSMPIRSYLQAMSQAGDTSGASYCDTGLWRDCNVPTLSLQFDDFSLPPRSLADHLLDCYWERVYSLYPFFHRPSFERAYESLWGSSKWPKSELPELNIGLGGAFDSGPQSIVFHCALNAIFGMGCHFSDIPAAQREAAAYTFFLRSKRFVGLDLLDTGTIGVVQTLLIISLLLQSTPYPNRCWNAIGVACRVAQGLGLHEEAAERSIKPLEKEVRRRTWHGCVIMDMLVLSRLSDPEYGWLTIIFRIVSMTYGRPSMTSHISPVPLPDMDPSQADDPCALSGQPCDHKLGYMTFYVSTIQLYKILESILSDIYNAWQSRSSHQRSMSLRGVRHRSLDVIMELEDKLSVYETSVPAVLNWTNMASRLESDDCQQSIFKRQQNVLRARYVNRMHGYPNPLAHAPKVHPPPPSSFPPHVHPALFRGAHGCKPSLGSNVTVREERDILFHVRKLRCCLCHGCRRTGLTRARDLLDVLYRCMVV